MAGTGNPVWFTYFRAAVLFCIASMVNYVDRGIVAGAGTTIMGCKTPSLCGFNATTGESNQTGFGIDTAELGLLQSGFMVGYIVAGIWFARSSGRS